MRLFATLMFMLFLSACSREDMLQRFSSPSEQAEARAWIDKLRARDYAAIEHAMDDGLKDDKLHSALEAMAALIPAQEPSSVKLVGAELNFSGGARIVNSTFEYEFARKWFLINVAMKEQGKARTIVGFHLQAEEASIESQNRFSLAGKSLLHYCVLGAATFSALLTLVALVACVRTRLERRKWLWILFILVGVGQLKLNWTTGEWDYMPIALQLFSAGAISTPYGPWLVSVALPLGAIWFLLWRRNRAALSSPIA
jgi:hypothetical protein